MERLSRFPDTPLAQVVGFCDFLIVNQYLETFISNGMQPAWFCMHKLHSGALKNRVVVRPVLLAE